MVYVTGDCHAEWHKFSTDAFPEQKEMTRDDIVIVCGDFGIWHDNNIEQWWLKWLEEKSFTICFCDGNHENFDRLYSDEFEVVDFHGGKAHKIRENIYHLMRGYVFDFCGKKFFAFGGASSHDIQDGIVDPEEYDSRKDFNRVCFMKRMAGEMFRINHMSWWEQEMPSQEEMEFGLKTLEENENKVDFIITHCAPTHMEERIGSGTYVSDKLTDYFEELSKKVDFQKWIFGHYHDDCDYGKYILLYDQIIRIL